MRTSVTFLTIYMYALLSSGKTSSDDRRWLVSMVELVELEYEDHCEQRAFATWSELIGESKGLSTKLERDKAFGLFSKAQTNEVRSVVTAHSLSSDDDVLSRKVKLLLQPGDTLLETVQWIKLVTFGDIALHKIRFATDYDCGMNTSCSLKELHNSLRRPHDEATLQAMYQSWQKKLPDFNEYLKQILPLIRNASRENNYQSVEEYWNSIVEYESAIIKARELWEQLSPLYFKLHKYVTLKLRGADAMGKPLPVYLLRSLTGDDWLNIIENLLPKHPDIYQKFHANLQLKNLGGLRAVQEAASLIKQLGLGDIESEIWTNSVYNGTCPATIVDWCKPNRLKAMFCKDISIANFMDAHELVMRIKHKQAAALHSNNTYILREANRFSAIYEAIPGFASLLSVNPHALNRAGLYDIDRFNYNPNHHRLVLQLISALRDLPKLNYYLAVDEWRLKALSNDSEALKISWSEFRKNFSLIESSNEDLLGDSYVLYNKPYLGKFMGLILKYQIYQSFAEELISDESDLIQHIGESNDRILETIIQGFGVSWPEMVKDLLAKREDGLESTGLTDYYRLLDEYLDSELELSTDNKENDDYVEPEVPETIPEENEIPDSNENEKNNVGEIGTHKDILENIVDTGDESNLKYGSETSTVGVLEIKNPVANGDQKSKDERTEEASYNTYWWIGIVVALALVVIITAIIARKRHNHRKQLERQRRDNTKA